MHSYFFMHAVMKVKSVHWAYSATEYVTWYCLSISQCEHRLNSFNSSAYVHVLRDFGWVQTNVISMQNAECTNNNSFNKSYEWIFTIIALYWLAYFFVYFWKVT